MSKVSRCKTSPKRGFRRLWADQEGSVYAILAASLVPIIGFVGAGFDYGRAYLVESRLQAAVDAAVIAGVRAQQGDATKGEGSPTWRTVDRYLTANFPNNYMGFDRSSRDIDAQRDGFDIEVSLEVRGHVSTTLLRVLGIDRIPVRARAAAEAGETVPKAVEVLLVLDNTGSMAGARMTSLKTAARNFVQTVYGDEQQRENFALGMLPYNIVVNVGRHVMKTKPNMIKVADFPVAEQFFRPFLMKSPTEPLSWKGCLYSSQTKYNIGSDINNLYQSNGTSQGDKAFDMGKTMPGERNVPGSDIMPAFEPYLYPPITVDSFDTVNNRYKLGSDRDNGAILANMPSMRPEILRHYGNNICTNVMIQNGQIVLGNEDRTCNDARLDTVIDPDKLPNYSTWGAAKRYGHRTNESKTGPSPNYECPAEAMLVDYGRSKQSLINYINNDNEALPNIGTFHTPAITWAYRLMTRTDVFPRTAPDDIPVERVVVFMTDGNFDSKDDGRVPTGGGRVFDTAYTSYKTYEHRLTTNSTARNTVLDTMPLRFNKTCQAMKAEGIEIYTIAFALANNADGNTTREMFRTCATNRNTHFFEATNGTDLDSAFQTIAMELVDLHLSE